MSLHALYIYRLATELNHMLQGAHIHALFSSEKNHLLLCFELRDKSYLNLSFRIVDTELFIHFPEHIQSESKLRLDQFKSVWNAAVLSVEAHPGERSFHITLDTGNLLFLCYGRHANVLLLQQDEISGFRKKGSKIPEAAQMDLNTLATQSWPADKESFLSSSFSTLQLKTNLSESGLSMGDFLGAYLNGPIYINEVNEKYQFDAFPAERNITQFSSLVDTLNTYAELALARHFFIQNKTKLLSELQDESQRVSKRIKALDKQLAQLALEKNYRHLGDLILSNLPQIQAGMLDVEVIDYLDGNNIRIPLKEKLSPQDNAQRYYRKAKNQHLQESRLKEEKDQLEEHFFHLLEKLETIETTQEMSGLRGHLKERKKQEGKEMRLSYHPFSYQGFQILVGRQAKDNDELSLKIAKKDDLWLHARDISGSHVIIKKQSGRAFPESIILAAAGLALWFSKRKTEALAPVIYTEKKFVRKRKGDPPGAVVVEKEKVIMAAPLSPDYFEKNN